MLLVARRYVAVLELMVRPALQLVAKQLEPGRTRGLQTAPAQELWAQHWVWQVPVSPPGAERAVVRSPVAVTCPPGAGPAAGPAPDSGAAAARAPGTEPPVKWAPRASGALPWSDEMALRLVMRGDEVQRQGIRAEVWGSVRANEPSWG